MPDNRLKNIICPAAHTLNGYLNNSLSKDEYRETELHVSGCPYCLFRIAEAAKALKKDSLIKKIRDAMARLARNTNIWILLSILGFCLSFILPRHFIQFLVMTVLFGIKWIIDNKNTKMLIMIHEAWNSGSANNIDHPIKSFERK